MNQQDGVVVSLRRYTVNNEKKAGLLVWQIAFQSWLVKESLTNLLKKVANWQIKVW